MPKPDPLQAGSSFSFKLVGVGVTTVTGGGTTAATGAAITGTGTTTAAGFSAAGGAGIIGKEAKKSGEFSVANEQVAQLDIDVGQIERVMEEEQKTPEVNESDESLDGYRCLVPSVQEINLGSHGRGSNKIACRWLWSVAA